MGNVSLRNEMLQAARCTNANFIDLSAVKSRFGVEPSALGIADIKDFEAYHAFLRKLLVACFCKQKALASTDLASIASGKKIWKECQLFRLYHALIDYFRHGKLSNLPLIQVPSGAVPIEAEGWLSWLNVPTAGLHEELGMLLSFYAFISKNEKLLQSGKKLVEWQKQLIQSNGLPLTELFSQEDKNTYKLHLVQSYAFYLVAAWIYSSGDLIEVASQTAEKLREVWDSEVEERLSLGILMLDYVKKYIESPQKKDLQVSSALCDPHTQLVAKRYPAGYGYATLCGGGSGLGTYCYKGVKILTWGPQSSPLGSCEQFGIYSPIYRPYRKKNHTHLSASSDGFSITGNVKVGLTRSHHIEASIQTPQRGDWFKVSQSLQKDGVQMSWNWLKQAENADLHQNKVCWFIKASNCQLMESKQHIPLRSLDHFNGTCQPALFSSSYGKTLFTCSEKLKMDLIPLAGEGNFWGADYLLALETPTNRKVSVEWRFVSLKD